MNRQDIVQQLVTELKTISGINDNVYSEFYMWDDIPTGQYPVLIVQAGMEMANYEGKSTLDTDFRAIIYGYVLSYETRETLLNELIQDVRTIIHADPTSNGLTMDRQMVSIATDEGIQKPHGIFRMEVKCWTHEYVASR